MSKFYHYLNATLLGAIILAGFAACQDEDFDVSEATLKAKAYDYAFIKQFGEPDPDQSWDFFTQSIESLEKGIVSSSSSTRAVPEGTWDASGDGWGIRSRTAQPDYITNRVVLHYNDLLPESKNNYTKGQTQYKLISSGDGNFTISAIWYGGIFETIPENNFELWIHFIDKNNTEQSKKLFDGGDVNHQSMGFDFRNPGLSSDIHLDAGTEFWFEIQYRQNWMNHEATTHYFYSNSSNEMNYDYRNYERYPQDNEVAFPYPYDEFKYKDIDYYHTYNGPTQLLYSETVYGENEIKRYMVIGFEDAWDALDFLDFDYNDIVLYIDGNLPVPEAKRFFAEDLKAYDWDFNDIVIDVEYQRCILRAVGGTLPLYFSMQLPNGKYIETGELHEMMYNTNVANGNTQSLSVKDEKGNYRPINVGASNGLKLEPTIVLQWDTPLSVDDLKKLGNNPTDVTFHIADPNAAFIQTVDLNSDVTSIHFVNPNTSHPNECPAIVAGTISTRWMQEFQLITKGYPTFYDGHNKPAQGDQALEDIWCNYQVIPTYLYNP